MAEVAGRLLSMGCYEVALGDTIGAATPASTAQLLDVVTSTRYQCNHNGSNMRHADSSTDIDDRDKDNAQSCISIDR